MRKVKTLLNNREQHYLKSLKKNLNIEIRLHQEIFRLNFKRQHLWLTIVHFQMKAIKYTLVR